MGEGRYPAGKGSTRARRRGGRTGITRGFGIYVKDKREKENMNIKKRQRGEERERNRNQKKKEKRKLILGHSVGVEGPFYLVILSFLPEKTAQRRHSGQSTARGWSL